ncbi:SDR family NAD(P)-dependent oxidoreductase [Spongiibacter sp. KMU-166]|uniref:SDR family NAD(P)-dependent oxidoreductase n=1 Tax=Spongiibacter thalassae TaxID=2721624 RepID=A0ABX1GF34_9GAMM|nr:SDR family NAD(P)-dependent oxidoreductase [Spongiibacter thalassae]NKI17815.1 SDR family NAD(P)-dependent oxidoreductase [Spongiibacter thalassae]
MPTKTRVALITGCSSGLGEALATHCLNLGYRVYATARCAEDIRIDHSNILRRALDVADTEAVGRLCDEIQRDNPRLDLLINNAGYGAMGPLLDLPIDRLQQQLAINTVAPLHLVQRVIESLHAGSTVVNIGSVSAGLGTPFAGGYCASKSALHTLSDVLRMELAPFGVQVMVVRAGAIQSKFANRASAELANSTLSPRYQPLAARIAERAGLSQRDATPAMVVAEKIIAAAEKRRSPPYLGVAHGHRSLHLLGQLPSRLKDAILERRFGLRQLAKDVDGG